MKRRPMVECTVAMLVSDRSMILRQILGAVHNQTYDSRKVKLVFAENSSDGSLEILREFQSEHEEEYVAIEILEKVDGIPQARNRCLERAWGEFLVFMDDDVVAPPDALKTINAHMQTNPECALVGLRYLPPTGRSPLEKLPYIWRLGVLPGMGCTGIRRVLLEAVGGFDESLAWGEDLDYVCRIKRSGSQVTILREPRPVHLNDGLSVGANPSSPLTSIMSAWEPKAFDAKLLFRHRGTFLPVILRKYGPSMAFLAALALIPLTWVPAALMVAIAWTALQLVYSGRRRIYMPFVALVSGFASLLGLGRGLLRASSEELEEVGKENRERSGEEVAGD